MTAPYYADDYVELWLGDCRDQTAWLSANTLIMDPPYGTQFTGANPEGGYGRRQRLARTAGRDAFVIANDDTTEVRDAALAMWQGRGPILVFGSPRASEPPGDWVDRLVWNKRRPGMNGGPWRYVHESIFVSAGFVRRSNDSMSIITAHPDQTDHVHAKPLALMTRLVDCAPDGVIADPFAGSGSALVAAKQLGRRAIGVEINELYCEIAARRLSQDVLDFGGVA